MSRFDRLVLAAVAPLAAVALGVRLYRFTAECVAMDRWRRDVYARQPGWGR